MDFFSEALAVMDSQMGQDVCISLATLSESGPSVRVVDGYYHEGSFYVVSHMASHKMKDIAKDPRVAACYKIHQIWGKGVNMGNPKKPENLEFASTLRKVFFKFYDRHVNEDDPECCILRIIISNAVVFSPDAKYIVDFHNRSAQKIAMKLDIIE
ncbi:MAG TPA: pyridoxamine 5'-phosphate oxidase family protein [Petrotogaceae bacterium]|nr:pyridoxamine 5'-phosphate oxidase family protein [Petrotogaceae bacterium]